MAIKADEFIEIASDIAGEISYEGASNNAEKIQLGTLCALITIAKN